MNCWRRIVLSVFIIEIFKHWLHNVFQVKSLAAYYLRDKNELYSRNPKTVAYGTESVSFMAPKIWSIVPQELENSQTKLSMSVMENLLATCWFYIIIMCGTGIKTFFILSIICYIIDVFSFSFVFFAIESSILTQKQNG